MKNSLLRRGYAPSSFKELAGRVFDAHMSEASFTEAMLQDAFQAFLCNNHWWDCEVEANRPRRGDLALLGSRNSRPYFVVELKRSIKLKPSDDMQARGYAALHKCPCVITNGLHYKLVLAEDTDPIMSMGRLPMKVTGGRHILIELGTFAPDRMNGALERALNDLFSSAAEGPVATNEKVAQFVRKAAGRARGLPPPRSFGGFLPERCG